MKLLKAYKDLRLNTEVELWDAVTGRRVKGVLLKLVEGRSFLYAVVDQRGRNTVLRVE